jgi:rubrerythrin
MLRSVLLDMLSEFLMVEQGGLQLYRTALGRCTNPQLQSKYTEFLKETAHHREVLATLITELGGDPSYVSPTARAAQFKASKLLESALVVDGLSQPEVELSDLENVLLAETKDHADWSLLSQMAKQASQSGLGKVGQMAGSVAGAAVTAMTGGPSDQMDMETLQAALSRAVAEVEHQEDEHLQWAREMHATLSMQMATMGPAPSPMRWMQRITTPELPIESFHPRPITEGLLEFAGAPQWQPSEIVRSMQMPLEVNGAPSR